MNINIHSQFKSAFAIIEQRFYERVDNFTRELWRQLMIRTPVDSGTLRYNWRVAPGQTPGNYHKKHPSKISSFWRKDHKGRPSKYKNEIMSYSKKTKSQELTRVSSKRSLWRNFYPEPKPTRTGLIGWGKRYDHIIIYNKTPYLNIVETGNYKNPSPETRANAGFIRRSVAAAQASIK